MTGFTPLSALAGGALIGLAAVVLMAAQGRIAGISGIASGALDPRTARGERGWRLAFLLGLLAAPLVLVASGRVAVPQPAVGTAGLIVAGLLVGFGTLMGNGCTSGHGVCGLARLSPRSLAATLTFMAAAGLTLFLVRHGV